MARHSESCAVGRSDAKLNFSERSARFSASFRPSSQSARNKRTAAVGISFRLRRARTSRPAAFSSSYAFPISERRHCFASEHAETRGSMARATARAVSTERVRSRRSAAKVSGSTDPNRSSLHARSTSESLLSIVGVGSPRSDCDNSTVACCTSRQRETKDRAGAHCRLQASAPALKLRIGRATGRRLPKRSAPS